MATPQEIADAVWAAERGSDPTMRMDQRTVDGERRTTNANAQLDTVITNQNEIKNELAAIRAHLGVEEE